MGYRLIGAKPLSETILEDKLLDPREKWNFNLNSDIFIHENVYECFVYKIAAIFNRLQCFVNNQHGITRREITDFLQLLLSQNSISLI